MKLLKKFEFTPRAILKITAMVLGAVIVIGILFSLIGSFMRTMPVALSGMPGMRAVGSVHGNFSVAQDAILPIYSESARYDMAPAYTSAGYGGGYDTKTFALSARNVATAVPAPSLPPMYPQGTTGDSAEAYEVTEYNASIESRAKGETCGALAGLKSRDYVIFENANDYDRGCSYSFKVKHANVPEILAFIKGLDPKDLSENTYTIKSQIDDFTSETEILEKKRASIDETLSEAIAAYDSIQKVAAANQDAESLAKIIDSKIQLIERLTQERININEQLDRYARAKADQLDRLEYTHFSVSVYEHQYIDSEQLADSWKESIRQFFNDVNRIAQDLTVNLVLLLVLALQYILYLLILVVIAKYVWKAVRYIWHR